MADVKNEKLDILKLQVGGLEHQIKKLEKEIKEEKDISVRLNQELDEQENLLNKFDSLVGLRDEEIKNLKKEIHALYEIVPQTVAKTNSLLIKKIDNLQKDMHKLVTKDGNLVLDYNMIDNAINAKVENKAIDRSMGIIVNILKSDFKRIMINLGMLENVNIDYCRTLFPRNGYLEENGWYISGEIKTNKQENVSWIDSFIAYKRKSGFVSGNYENNYLWAANQQSALEFIQDNPAQIIKKSILEDF